MASSVIHMCIANEINKQINRDNEKILIGTIAPDISKHLGKDKTESHFQELNDDIPNLEKFLNKYQKNLSDDFVLGYYIHLYVDYLWFKYFVPEFILKGKIFLLDGSLIKYTEEDYIKYFYNDYTNLNILLTQKYNLDLDFLEKKEYKFKNIITEIPMNQIQKIIDKTVSISKKSYESKLYVIDTEIVEKFIDATVSIITSNLEEIGYLKS